MLKIDGKFIIDNGGNIKFEGKVDAQRRNLLTENDEAKTEYKTIKASDF